MSRIFKNKIKSFFALIFESKNKERGIIIAPLLINSAAVIIGGLGIMEFLGGYAKDVADGLIVGMVNILFWSSYTLAKLSSVFFGNIVSKILIGMPITTDPTYIIAWGKVKDLANMFIVLGFIAIGIATTLRIQDYQAKKLLLPLIMIALLVNFSNVFVGIFIDASQIATKYFLKVGGDMGVDIVSSMYEANVKLGQDSGGWKEMGRRNVNEYLSKSLPFSAMFIIIALLFFYMAFLFIARQAVLAVLFILSPMAFVCWVFPQTKKIWASWWEQFIKWSFIGATAGFFVYIAWSTLINLGRAGEVSDFALITILVFLFIGFKVATKSSAMGASAVMGLAGGALGYAMGATKVGMKGLSNMTGLTRAGQGAKDVATRTLERMNLMDKGTTAMNQRKRLEGVSKGLEAAYGNDEIGNAELAKIATQKAVSARARDQKTAAAELLMKRKAFGYIPEKQQEAVAAYATARGVAKETFTKDRPDLLTAKPSGLKERLGFAAPEGTKEAKEELLKEERARLETSPKLKIMAPHEREMWIEEGLKKYKSAMSSEAIDAKRRELAKAKKDERKLGALPVTDADVKAKALEDYKPTKGEIATEKTKMGPGATDEEAIKRLKSYYKPSTETLLDTRKKMVTERAKEKTLDFKYATEEEARQNLIDKEAKRLKDDLGFSGSDLDAEIKSFSDSLTSDKIEDGLTALNNEREAKAIKKMGPAKLRELPESMIDESIVEHSDYKTLDRAYLEMTPEQKDKYKTLLPNLQSKVLSELGLAAGSSVGKVKAEINKLKRSTSKTDQEKGAKIEELTNKYLLIKG